MLKMFKNKKAQNTAEYAILIALVIGGVIAMQTYAQRTLQGRLRDASVLFRDETNAIGNTLQYEPYYSNTYKDVDKTQTSIDTFNEQNRTSESRQKEAHWYDRTEYQADAVVNATIVTGTGDLM